MITITIADLAHYWLRWLHVACFTPPYWQTVIYFLFLENKSPSLPYRFSLILHNLWIALKSTLSRKFYGVQLDENWIFDKYL